MKLNQYDEYILSRMNILLQSQSLLFQNFYPDGLCNS
uniref:Uncharacterized protein n=1 Tax=Lepeophtheirus salmonis TaxID=72036 RepID=A0A0K2ULC8_LEPSM